MSIKAVTVGGRSDIKKITIGGGTLFEKQASIQFNQLIPNPTFTTTDFWKFKNTYALTVADNVGTCMCNKKTTGTNPYSLRACAPLNVLIGHVYYFGISVLLPFGNWGKLVYAVGDGIASNEVGVYYTAGVWSRLEALLTPKEYMEEETGYTGSGNTTGFWVPLKGNQPAAIGDQYSIRDAMCVDLTEMYGAGNEPTLAEFRAAYPLDSYPYTPIQ